MFPATPVSIDIQEQLWERIIDFDNGRFVVLNADNNTSLALVGRSLKYPNYYKPIDIEGLYYETGKRLKYCSA